MISLLSIFIISGYGYSYAGNHRGGGHDKERKELKSDRKRGGAPKGKGHGNIKHNQPKPPRHHAVPAPPRYRPKHYNHAYHYPNYTVHDNLAYMVGRIVKGGHDVNVWQVDPYTYVVRFRKGNRIYSQYIYPYEGRYGNRNTISVDWTPLSPWTLIPSIHLNLNL